ncbi:unnamed protein product, partial [marine sediment metagenome]
VLEIFKFFEWKKILFILSSPSPVVSPPNKLGD